MSEPIPARPAALPDPEEDRDKGTDFPRLKGHCPACGLTTLFRGSQGYITCSWLKCPNPGAAHDLLAAALAGRPASPAPQVEALRTALKRVTDDMDRAGGDGYGMPECPWCRCQYSGDVQHFADCELLLARQVLADVDAGIARPASPPAPAPCSIRQDRDSWVYRDEDGTDWRIHRTGNPDMPLQFMKEHIMSLSERQEWGASPPEPATWQPIETAPKDGRRVLVVNEYRVDVACWSDYMKNWMGLFDPTHWMPLPELPTGAAHPEPATPSDQPPNRPEPQ